MSGIIKIHRWRPVLVTVLGLLTIVAVACTAPPRPVPPAPTLAAISESSPVLPPINPAIAPAASPEAASSTPEPFPSPTPTTATEAPRDRVIDEPIAILTFVDGDVELEEASAGRAIGLALQLQGRKARPNQQIRTRTVVRVANNARATVVCYDGKFFKISGGQKIQTGTGCQSGGSLPKGSPNGVLPCGGSLLCKRGSLVVQGKIRGDKKTDYGRIPVILSPRNTSLINPAPKLRWVAVPDAAEYLLDLLHPVAFKPQVVLAKDAGCAEDATPRSQVCAVAWPAEWVLEPGETYFLTISAKLENTGELRPSESSQLVVLDAERTSVVQAESEAIGALGLDDVTQDMLLAGLYAREKLYGDAIAAYERVLQTQPTALVYVTLGDTYREIELFRWAFAAYRQALDLLDQDEDDPLVRAAAEFGNGQVYFAYDANYTEAAKHFEAATALYEQLGDSKELEAARKGLAVALAKQLER